MIFVILGVVVIGVIVAVALTMKSKGSDDGSLSVPKSPASPAVGESLTERLEQHTNVTSHPGVGPVGTQARLPGGGALDEAIASAAAQPPSTPEVAEQGDAPLTAPVGDQTPEPMIRARVQPAPPALGPKSPAPTTSPDDDADDSATMSRLRVPGQRSVAKSAPAAEPAPPPDPVIVWTEPAPEPEPNLATAPDVTEPEPNTAPEVAPAPEPVSEPEAELDAQVEPGPAVAQPAELAPDQGVDPDSSNAPAEITPEPATAAAVPMTFVLEPEPTADPVDHILKALVNRAKERQVGIAEVAAELVEQANLEDRDIDEVLADLVDRVEDDDDQVDSGARLEELTFFNESVPRRPGQITDYDRLDKIAKKKVIIRVLCLLVAMQEDNRLKPSDPASEAETRHWPLARAVWPVPLASTAEAEAAQAEAAGDPDGDGDDTEGDKKSLPGRRLLRTKR